MKVEVLDYDPGWPVAFSVLRARLWRVVEDFAIAIEHVGSTSVPGLAAKPVLDIDIIVKSEQGVLLAIERLTAIDYTYCGNMGIEGREAFRAAINEPRHNLYVCREDSAALRDHLTFRDYLREHSETAQAYAALKRDLALKFPDDIDSYATAKTSFVLGILESAGVPRGRLDHIRRENGLAV
jgi:GrpB-like predicted nucleotidyltransferase (UPF0157 family)